MTERRPSLLELHRADRLLDQIAGRPTPDQTSMGDPVLRLLAGLAQAVDEAALPAFADMLEPGWASDARSRPRVRRLAAMLAVAITLCSSGVATAAVSNPFRPIKAVVHQLYDMGRSGTSDSEGILGGLKALDSPVQTATTAATTGAQSPLPRTTTTFHTGKTVHHALDRSPAAVAVAQGKAGSSGHGSGYARSALEPSRSAASRDLPGASGPATPPPARLVPKAPQALVHGPEPTPTGPDPAGRHARHVPVQGQHPPTHHKPGSDGHVGSLTRARAVRWVHGSHVGGAA